MAGLFKGHTDFNKDISKWDVSSVTNMSNTFRGTAFNQPIGSWDVSSVTDMEGMFSNTPFNQDISAWDVSRVTNMKRMFSNNLDSAAFNQNTFNQPIGMWNVSSVTDMSFMFDGAVAFNHTICEWGTKIPEGANVTKMFRSAKACPVSKNDQDLDANPPGPFCHSCP